MWVEARSFISSAIVNIDDLIKYDLCVLNLFCFIKNLIDLLILDYVQACNDLL